MAEKLICPVVSETEPLLGKRESVHGQNFAFSTPLELKVGINLSKGFIDCTCHVDLIEAGQNRGVSLLICSFAHSNNPDFVRYWTTFLHEGHVIEMRETEVSPLQVTDPRVGKYQVEGPTELTLVGGTEYDFIAGKKPSDLFVDGWDKKAQKPSWRLSLPLELDEHSSYAGILVPQSKFLIFG